MKKIIFSLIAIGVIMLNAGTIVASIGDVVITSEDVEERVKSLPPQYSTYYSSPEGKQKVLKQMIEEKLIYLEAENKGLGKNPEVIKMADKFKQEIMTNYYLKEELAKLTVNDVELKKAYEENRTKYAIPESVKASHILVKTEEEADKLTIQLNKGANFEELAKKNSTCPSSARGGDLDFFTRGQMVKPFEDAVFALKKGEITKKPVQTQFGWHVIKLTDKKSPKEKSFEEVKTELKNELLQDKQKSRVEEIVKELEAKYPVKK